ncbi:hypothetical protein AVEN_165531-1 [Araneus ventricosus]|uniref:Uncharacterized protein n=1 Tax=Araneus ventricosus TaxID=182803 RepID=A0A4Y2NCD8_ARAVE|nr:hypothetical protein AVEN_165531-1 [Araneus ventricosus]
MRHVPTTCLSTQFALLPVVGAGRIYVAGGLASSSVVSRVMVVNSSHIKGKGRGQTASSHPFLWPIVFRAMFLWDVERLDEKRFARVWQDCALWERITWSNFD